MNESIVFSFPLQIGCTTKQYFCTEIQKMFNFKERKNAMWYDEDGYGHDDFEGTYAHDYEGFDEDTIYDAFEGDPDAYWNID